VADQEQKRISADQYWPTLDADELLPKAVAQIDAYHEFTWQSGLVDIWQRTLTMYNWALASSRIERVGKKGQYLKLVLNDFASLVRRAHTLLTAERPGMEPAAQNGDYKSRGAVSLCRGLLEYYLRRQRGERKMKRAVWRGFLAGEMITFCWFNRNLGEIEDIDIETGQPIFGGDVDMQPVHPIDLIRDITVHTFEECDWFIVRTRQNRWNVLALYAGQSGPADGADEAKKDLRTRILAARNEDAKGWKQRTIGLVDEPARGRETDQVEVFHLIHRRTPAVPRGRWVTFLDAETALEDRTLDEITVQEEGDTREPPSWDLEDFVQRTASEECEGIPFGFSPAWEQLAPQDAVNIGESTLLTNLANHGVQTVAAPAGAIVKPSMLAEGMRLLELETPRAEGTVTPVNLLTITDGMIAMPDRWVRRMGTNFGVNDTARGNPPQGIKAGNALALLTTQTIESLQGPEQAKDELWEMYGTAMVKHFQWNVTTKRLAAIVGTGSEQHLVALQGSDLDGIERVNVESVPHTARSAAQKRDTAEFYAGIPGSGFTLEDAQDVLDTGALDPRVHKRRDKYLLIQKENEMMLEGKVPRVIISDQHVDHINEHLTLLDRPDAREDKLLQTVVLAHVQEHQNMLAVMPPMLAMVRGQPAMPQGPGMGAPQPSPQAGAIDDVQAIAGQATGPGPGGPPPAPRMELPIANPVTGEPASVGIAQPPPTAEMQ